MSNTDRYKPPIPLGELSAEERRILCENVRLRWEEVRAVMLTPTQNLLDHLAAQARIVQAVQVIAYQRELIVAESEMADLEKHRRMMDGDGSYG